MSVNRWAPDSTTGLEKVDLTGLLSTYYMRTSWNVSTSSVIGARCDLSETKELSAIL